MWIYLGGCIAARDVNSKHRIGGYIWYAGMVIGVILIALAMTECSARKWPADAAVKRQCWFYCQPVRHSRHRYRGHRPVYVPPVDCKQINDAVKALTGENLERTRRGMTTEQIVILDKCAKESTL